MLKRMMTGLLLTMAAVGMYAQESVTSDALSAREVYGDEPVVSGEVQPTTVQFGIDFGYSLGLTQREFGETFTRKDGNMYGISIKALALWNIDRHWTAGGGIGIDSYNYGPNTLPIFLTGRYRPFEKRGLSGLYAFTDLGYAPGVGNYSAGMLWDLGIGWRKMFRRHFGINAQFGYGLKQFRTKYYDGDIFDITTPEENLPVIILTEQNTTVWRHSLRFSIGLLF